MTAHQWLMEEQRQLIWVSTAHGQHCRSGRLHTACAESLVDSLPSEAQITAKFAHIPVVGYVLKCTICQDSETVFIIVDC